ncbi:diacylglycerol kinase family protein [Salinicoccus albus]|uniref:diacylglycerol kinase family protein n=1 Tax=Salinicoccus albus TaxID=418756 RepID=UPI00036ECF33|nr:diacylglycerol kinase family protein [Salinicoccus albus]
MTGRLLRRFKFAFMGLKTMLKKDMHVLAHMISTVLVVLLGLFFSLEKVEWLFLTSAIFAVLVTEVMNTGVEFTVDLVTEHYHEYARAAKDVSAAAVFLACLYAVIIGLVIFIPYIL